MNVIESTDHCPMGFSATKTAVTVKPNMIFGFYSIVASTTMRSKETYFFAKLPVWD